MRERKKEKAKGDNHFSRKKEAHNSMNAVNTDPALLTPLLAILPGFIYRCKNDKDWTMFYLSDQCEAVTGYPAKDFIHNKRLAYNDIIREDDRTAIYALWEKALAENRAFEHEYRIITAAGEERWVWERGKGIYNPEGQLLYLEGYIEDITRRKHTEEKYRMLAENTSDVIWTMDLNMQTTYISPSVKALLKEDPNEHIQKSLLDKMLP